MSDYLVNHALKNVWCTPDQDNQVILKPARITPYNGVASSWRVLWTPIYMPAPYARFHLFQIGQIHPYLISLFPKLDRWVKISDSCMTNQSICDLYTKDGIQFPRTESWYMVTEERNILIAIKENKKLPIDFNKDELYVRIYNNEFFSSQQSSQITDIIDVQGGVMTSVEQILDLQSKFEAAKLKIGGVYCFRNGYKVKDISLVNTNIGDVVEFVYDSSIYKVIDFNISQLKTFDSEIDFKGKYLLHYTGGLGDTIDYQDDIDLFLIHGTTQKGVYYHKNATDALRMVTHRDYSTPVAYVSAFLQKHLTLLDPNITYLRLHIRKSGYQRNLVDEHHRIKELYKLDDSLIRLAMTGVDSTLLVWKASQLEKSNYVKLMGLKANQVTKPIVLEAYGYNATANLVAKSVHKTHIFSGQTVVDLPYFYQKNVTAFEYDAEGKLIGNYYHVQGHLYNCTNSACKYVELIHGQCDNVIDDFYDVGSVTLDPKYDYRFYITPKDNNAQNDIWTDVTNDLTKYSLVSNVATWLVSTTHNTLVRSNKKTLLKTHNVNIANGTLSINLSHMQTVNGSTTDRVMEVPMGELDVFLNRHLLIEGLDYCVHFPTVHIYNKEYLVETLNQEVIIRFKGLCQKDLSRNDLTEVGFIKNNVLSVDHRFDIRDDKVIRINVAGKIKTLDELKFNEDLQSYELHSSNNGKPYCIKDIVVPLKELTAIDTYDYRNESKKIDQQISDYLSLKIPANQSNMVNPITDLYKVFSPFISKIIAALRDNLINNDIIKLQYNDMQVRELVSPYLYLLENDPIHEENRPDKEFVKIHPHPYKTILDMNIYHYTFVNRVIKLYADGLIDLSSYARIV